MLRRQFLVLFPIVVAAPAWAQAEQPEAVVRALYAAHQPAIAGTGTGVLQDARLRRRFFTPALDGAVRRDAEQSRRRNEVGALDFDPLTDSQEPEVRGLEVRAQSQEGDRATVAAAFGRGEGERVELLYTLARVNGRWLVYDVARQGAEPWSLRGLLSLRP